MGLDINLFRKEKGGDPEAVKASQKKRFRKQEDIDIVDQIVATDEEWRKKNFQVENLRKEHKVVLKKIADKKKESKGQDPCEQEIKESVEIDNKIKLEEQAAEDLRSQLDLMISKCGNIVDDSVPVSQDEALNGVVRTWGDIPSIKITNQPGGCYHHQILAMIDGYDPKRGQKVAGHRGYFLKGFGALLNMALVQYGTKFLAQREYTPVTTPLFMKKHIMAETAQLADFEDQLYKIDGKQNTEDKDDLFLIATSEQPISGYFRGDWLEPSELPIRFAGYSSCFRKEAGAAGKDTWGVFRVHQFEKIEQFVVSHPDKSAEEHERMIQIAEDFYKSLKLPYRVVNIVSGELNDAAAKKYDLEAWFPGYNTYRELVSASNCTDYQSRSLETRIRIPKNQQKTSDKPEKPFVHMLNATLCATTRTLCCILENYQEEKGVRVPEVLVPFVGVDFIPYVKPVPKKEDLQ